jgi:hypothetical protein
VRTLTKVALGATAASLVWGLATLKPVAPEPGIPMEGRTAPVHIAEDSPLWDCRTMGNKICGSGEIHAENEATKFLAGMLKGCEAQGMGAETWVERHPAGESRPHKWYEVLGECAGVLPG